MLTPVQVTAASPIVGETDHFDYQSMSSVFHELRSPIGCIKGYASTMLLAPELLDDRAVATCCLENILEASAELEELVEHLLDLSRIGANVFSVTAQAIGLPKVVHKTVQRWQARLPERQIVLDIPPDLPTVRADARRLAQVLDNLLDNATKYATVGPITVAAEINEASIVVSVIDRGPGIPPAELESIFEHFQRGKAASDRGVKGTGIGLALSRGIVEAQGGRIWAESPATPSDPQTWLPGAAVRFTLRTTPPHA